jgi:hypothetical protein
VELAWQLEVLQDCHPWVLSTPVVAWPVLHAVSPSSFSAAQQSTCCGNQKVPPPMGYLGLESGRILVLHGLRKVVVEKLRGFAGELDTSAVLVLACWQNRM